MKEYPNFMASMNIKDQFFDINEFKTNPIKSSFQTFMAQIGSAASLTTVLNLGKNTAILQDSQLTTAASA